MIIMFIIIDNNMLSTNNFNGDDENHPSKNVPIRKRRIMARRRFPGVDVHDLLNVTSSSPFSTKQNLFLMLHQVPHSLPNKIFPNVTSSFLPNNNIPYTSPLLAHSSTFYNSLGRLQSKRLRPSPTKTTQNHIRKDQR